MLLQSCSIRTINISFQTIQPIHFSWFIRRREYENAERIFLTQSAVQRTFCSSQGVSSWYFQVAIWLEDTNWLPICCDLPTDYFSRRAGNLPGIHVYLLRILSILCDFCWRYYHANQRNEPNDQKPARKERARSGHQSKSPIMWFECISFGCDTVE